jgi:hypothetical protein
MASAQEKEMGGNADLTNVTQVEPDTSVSQSFDKDLDTQDASETRLSSISTPSDIVPNGPPTQEMAAPETEKLEHQKSKGMIALIMSALCVSSCSLTSCL